MKFKKFISSFLTAGLLFNNTSSLASVVSEDGRYETFQGNNITINNVLEEDKVDIEIEGSTLVNILRCDGEWFNEESTLETESSITIGLSHYPNKYDLSLIKSNTKYTVIPYAEYEVIRDGNFYVQLNTQINGEMNAVFRIYKENFNKPILITTPNITDSSKKSLFIGGSNCSINIKSLKLLMLEGDWTNKKIPNYFEGMKSVGELEDNKLNIEAIGENLFDVEYFKEMIETHYDEGNYGYEVKDDRNTAWVVTNHNRLTNKSILSNNYKFKKNTRYAIKGDVYLDISNTNNHNSLRGYVEYTDGATDMIFHVSGITGSWIKTDIVTRNNKSVKNIYFTYGSYEAKGWFDLDSLYIGEYNPDKTEFNHDYNVQNIDINLKEPLRALPNGVKDRIIKRNGQWVVERHVKEVILGENIFTHGLIANQFQTEHTLAFSLATANRKSFGTVHLNNPIITDTFNANDYNSMIYNDSVEGVFSDSTYPHLYIRIKKNRLNNDYSIQSINNYFKQNKVKILYELAQPVYEPLDIEPIVNLYKDTTHINNNSTIPANMKIIVDRTLNRAHEAIEAAKSNPTVDNIAIARMWVNLLEDSSLKDELQDNIGEITQVEDMEIERKTVSSNIDLYVRSENALSMGLSTSSVTFDNYSSVSDSEMLNAVEVTIHSSLPYSFNTYLETPIESLDGESTIQPNTLSIRENSKTYQVFNNVKEKIVLNDNTDAGNNNIHNIDLKLSKNTADKANVYKTTIKFEAVQK